jgi:hypothetical protein
VRDSFDSTPLKKAMSRAKRWLRRGDYCNNETHYFDLLNSRGLTGSPARRSLCYLTSPLSPCHSLIRCFNTFDSLSQEVFSGIAAIALKTIWGKASDMENTINAEAEQVGCNSADKSQR